MKPIHFDVEEDGFYGAYWACKDTHTAAGTDSIETVPAIRYYIIISNVCSIHSFMLVCRGAIPIGSSLVVGFVHLAAESLRVSSRRRLGQTLGQIRKLFRNRKLAVSFFVPGTKTARL